MAHDRFDERHSFNVLGFIQLLYDTTCVNSDFWVKPVWGLGCHVHLINMSRTSIILSKSLFEESKIISFHNLTFVWVCGDADNNTCVLLINADNVNKSYFYISKLFKLQYHRLYFIIWVGVFIITGYTSPNIITIINISSTRLLLGRICMILVHSLTCKWLKFE